MEEARYVSNLSSGYIRIINMAAEGLKAGESLERSCPKCGGELFIGRSSINGHLWARCDDCEATLLT